MKKPKVIYEFDPVIYPYKLWVIVSKKPVVVADNFLEYSGNPILNIEKDTERLGAFTMSVMDKKKTSFGVVIYFRSKNDISYSLTAHESSHAAKFLFKHIEAAVEPHEPFEYVVGWIAGCIEKVKNNRYGKD